MKLLITILLLTFTSCSSLKDECTRNFEDAITEPPTPIGSVR